MAVKLSRAYTTINMDITKLSTFKVFGQQLKLEASTGVFMPSANGLFYARSIRIDPGERVIDIGTGSGVLAIAAAKCGARVNATDTDPRAVAAAERNAQINGVEIDVLSFYQALNETGVINIFRNAEGQWCTYGYVYELSLLSTDA